MIRPAVGLGLRCRSDEAHPARQWALPVTDLLAAAAARVRETAELGAQLPDAERATTVRELLAGPVHEALMRARTDGGERIPDALAGLARALREWVPDGADDGLPVRLRVLIGLLRRYALEPAWLLAYDNASGRVRPSRVTATWAGGTFLSTALPLPTHVENGHVFAWLPGFRDPRWGVPDEVYAMDGAVTLRHRLDQVLVQDGTLHLAGIGYLSELPTGPDDLVTVPFTGPAGAQRPVPAARGRRPDLVSSQQPELTRLAWGGWYAALPLAPFASAPGEWRASIEVSASGITRAGPMGTRRGPLADPQRSETVTCDGATVRCGSDQSGQLVVTVRRL